MLIPEEREIPAGREDRDGGIRLLGALSLDQIAVPFADDGSSSSDDDRKDHPRRSDHLGGRSDVGGLFSYPGGEEDVLEALSRPPAPGSGHLREVLGESLGDFPTFLQKSESSPAVPYTVRPTVVSDSHKLIISGFEI